MPVSEEARKKYTPTIGIECHVQLKTKTKLFAAVGNDARDAPPNSLVSHICLGMPGALPVLNEKALELAARAAFALNTKPQAFSKFDRKHYFYPDLPKGYQITQYEQPIIIGGYVELPGDGEPKKIGITRVHLEEDAGKNTHPVGADYSLVDLNRAGTPLLEIVSEPEIHSAADAKAYARELWLLMKYADVTDGDLYQGHVRFDVNISVSMEPGKMGTRSEIKNLNSFRSVEGAVAYEIERQIELLEKGQAVVQETRGWDEAKQKTIGQRGKEEAHDYRYMPEPDVPPVELSDQVIERYKSDLPTMPTKWRSSLKQLELIPPVVETLLDAEIENDDISYLGLIGSSLDKPDLARFIAGWEINFEIPWRRENIENTFKSLSDEDRLRFYTQVFGLLMDGKLNSGAAKYLLAKLMAEMTPVQSVEAYAVENNLMQVSDEGEIEKIVAEVIKENQKAAEDVKKGEQKAIGFLVGQVMAKSKGKANPALTQKIIKKQLGL